LFADPDSADHLRYQIVTADGFWPTDGARAVRH